MSADTLIGGLIAAALVIVVLYGAAVAFCVQVNATDLDADKRPEAVNDPQDPKFLGPFVDDLARAHRTLEGE